MENKVKEPLIDTIYNLYDKSLESKLLPDNFSREHFMVLILWLLYKNTTITDIINSKNTTPKICFRSIRLGLMIGLIIGFIVSAIYLIFIS